MSDGPMTDTEMDEICRQNPEARIERAPTGELLIMPPTFSGSSRRNSNTGGLLFMWHTQNPSLGVTFDSNGGFTLPDNSLRSPNAAWISMARWQTLSAEEQDTRFAPLCPDFVIELKSRTDSLRQLQRKMTDTWLANGTQLAFLIDPETETSWIYRAGQTIPDVFAGFDRELSGEPVLPGFALDLRWLR